MKLIYGPGALLLGMTWLRRQRQSDSEFSFQKRFGGTLRVGFSEIVAPGRSSAVFGMTLRTAQTCRWGENPGGCYAPNRPNVAFRLVWNVLGIGKKALQPRDLWKDPDKGLAQRGGAV